MPHSFWGLPDITPDIIQVNSALNFVLSNINRINGLYGGPILYSNGAGESPIEIKPGVIIGLPTLESKITAVSFTTDLANMLQFAGDLRSDMDEKAATPGVATGRIADLPRGNVSGIALELLFMPLLEKTEKKRCTYGKLIIDVSLALLALAEYSADIKVMLAWQSPIPHDDLASAQGALVKKQLGISDTTLQRELGYDPTQELEQSQTEDAKKLVSFGQGAALPPPANMPMTDMSPMSRQQQVMNGEMQ
jgi:hypothetical protein